MLYLEASTHLFCHVSVEVGIGNENRVMWLILHNFWKLAFQEFIDRCLMILLHYSMTKVVDL